MSDLLTYRQKHTQTRPNYQLALDSLRAADPKDKENKELMCQLRKKVGNISCGTSDQNRLKAKHQITAEQLTDYLETTVHKKTIRMTRSTSFKRYKAGNLVSKPKILEKVKEIFQQYEKDCCQKALRQKLKKLHEGEQQQEQQFLCHMGLRQFYKQSLGTLADTLEAKNPIPPVLSAEEQKLEEIVSKSPFTKKFGRKLSQSSFNSGTTAYDMPSARNQDAKIFEFGDVSTNSRRKKNPNHGISRLLATLGNKKRKEAEKVAFKLELYPAPLVKQAPFAQTQDVQQRLRASFRGRS